MRAIKATTAARGRRAAGGSAAPRNGPTGSVAPDRREQLLDAARAAFVDKGFDATKVSDIVARAGLAQGTFYLYFKSKLEIMLAVSADVTKAFYSSGMAALDAADDFASGIDAAVDAVLRLAVKQRDVIAVMHHGRVVNDVQAQNISVRLQFHTRIVDFVRRASSERTLPAGADAGVVADLCIAVVDAGVQAIAHNEAAPVEVLTREIGAFLKRALGIGA